MFRTEQMAEQLFGLAKHGLFVNHQERELVKSAARRLQEQAEKIAGLQRDLDAARAELGYVRAEREGIQREAELGVPEDFWDDMWPLS